jgi:hypothetical protein
MEKAKPAYEGLYSLINQAFLENHWAGYVYVRRTEEIYLLSN